MRSVKTEINCLIIFLAMASLAIFIVINLSFFAYGFAISYFRLNYRLGLSSTSLMKCYFFIVKYLEVPWDCNLHLDVFRASVRGLHHFRDVRHLVLCNNLCMVIFNFLSLKLLRNYYLQQGLWCLINTFKVLFAGLMVLLAIAFIDFQQFFINFHRVMFRNHDWVFNVKTDPVIKSLPMPFFAGCFLAAALLILGMLVLFIYYLFRSVKKE